MGLKDTIFFLYAFSAFGILVCIFALKLDIVVTVLSYLGILIIAFYPVSLALSVVFKKKDGSLRAGSGFIVAVLANVLCTGLFFLIWSLMNSPFLGNISMIFGVVMIGLLGLVIKEHMMGESEKKST